MIGFSGFIFIALTIQVLKGSYRSEIETPQGEGGGIETFNKLYQEKSEDNSGVFNFQSVADANTRINQGFIITNIMATVPAQVPFANGSEIYEILEAAIMPRILAPNKLKAGDRGIFRKYSGIAVQAGTSMGLSSVGDGYVNWGVFGGILFMFALGFLYNEVLKVFQKNSVIYPILIIFVPLVFYYPHSPGLRTANYFRPLGQILFFNFCDNTDLEI